MHRRMIMVVISEVLMHNIEVAPHSFLVSPLKKPPDKRLVFFHGHLYALPSWATTVKSRVPAKLYRLHPNVRMEPSWGGSTVTSRTITLLQDDIDGSDATQTVRFAIDGEYEIDISERNAKLSGKHCQFVGHARKVSGRRGRKAASSLGADMSKSDQMREWLMEPGYHVSERGRIPAWLQQVYNDRH